MANAPSSQIARLIVIAGCAMAAACSGGGGGGVTSPFQGDPSPPAISPYSSSFALPDAPTLGLNSPLEATPSATLGTLPANTVLPLRQSVFDVLRAQQSPMSSVEAGGATLTFKGTQTVNGVTGPIFTLDVPKLGVSQTLQPNGTGGSCCGFNDVNGRAVDTLNYTLTGVWNAVADGTLCGICTGWFVTGFQTPAGNVPSSGQAIYLGNGNSPNAHGSVSGAIYLLGNSDQVGVVTGSSSSLNVNFGNGQVSGTLSGLTATPISSSGALGAPQPWNQINLTGSLSGAILSGNTSTPSQPAGSLSFDKSSTGTIGGALFGPNAEELGAVWSLQDKVGVKTAIGVVSGTKQ